VREASDFFAAVKPGSHSDQFKVLMALYCLKADQEAVETKSVKNFLKLHFGTKIPANIGTCLRRYKAYVQVQPGPPLRWSLTNPGVAKLREITGLALVADTTDHYLTDIGIVCALDHPEFSAVVDATGGIGQWRDIGNPKYPHLYRACEITADSGEKLKVVATTSTSMGLTAASIVTTQLIMQYRPKIVVMIGIAAGTRDGNKQFGDVLIADPSVDYNSGKVVIADGVRDFLPDPYPIGLNPRVRSLLHKYKGNHSIFDSIREGWSGKVPPSRNHLYVGPLGAADQVIDDATRVLEIQRNWRKLIGVEMETYGVYRACYEAPEPKPRMVSIKAVCDFAAEKSDSWQAFAAYVAAQFAIRFFKAEWQALWPPK
jgi:nucleoside phosphorylase